ncbi:hypothetical protein FH063_006694 [Azospirillum argentinense]|uniref:Uncharacterized protein n=2 Tax=Azospirillum argentinense TaxID=2970906 RepID=A0A5B0KSI4_9PROT|nr:hypothetical protein FH063_006694 [Azospirillum argentinense]
MTERTDKAKNRPTYTVEPTTMAAIGGVGAVFGALRAVMKGGNFFAILAAAAVAGLACAIVGAVVSLHRKAEGDDASPMDGASTEPAES